MSGDLQKEIVPPPALSPAAASLEKTIGLLTVLYVLLFGASLAIIVRNSQPHPRGDWGTWAWAVFLGSAVCTRLFRQSLVRKYNAIISGGRPTPMQ
jgi:hypothetical protein